MTHNHHVVITETMTSVQYHCLDCKQPITKLASGMTIVARTEAGAAAYQKARGK